MWNTCWSSVRRVVIEPNIECLSLIRFFFSFKIQAELELITELDNLFKLY
jgi:hypothetical protein